MEEESSEAKIESRRQLQQVLIVFMGFVQGQAVLKGILRKLILQIQAKIGLF